MNSDKQLHLNNLDATTPALVSVNSLCFAGNQQFVSQESSFDFWASEFMSIFVILPFQAYSNRLISGHQYNWSPLISQTSNSYFCDLTDPFLSVRYNWNGQIALSIGEAILATLQINNDVAGNKPVAVGLHYVPTGDGSTATATLFLYDNAQHSSTAFVNFSSKFNNSFHPDKLTYGSIQVTNLTNSVILDSSFYALEINHYYGNEVSITDDFIAQEFNTLDKMYGLSKGR